MLHEESSNDHLNLMSKVLKLRKRTVGLAEILKVQQLVSYVLCISRYSHRSFADTRCVRFPGQVHLKPYVTSCTLHESNSQQNVRAFIERGKRICFIFLQFDLSVS